jgi:hypothetical protein
VQTHVTTVCDPSSALAAQVLVLPVSPAKKPSIVRVLSAHRLHHPSPLTYYVRGIVDGELKLDMKYSTYWQGFVLRREHGRLVFLSNDISCCFGDLSGCHVR